MMQLPKTVAAAIHALAMIDMAWDQWAKQEPTAANPDEQASWQAGYEAFELASSTAREALRDLRCTSLPEIAAKLNWMAKDANDYMDSEQAERFASLHDDLAGLIDRPTQDAFAVKLRAYQRAVQDCDEGKAAGANDEVMGPLFSAAFDSGRAVLLEPAPDVAALLEKRVIFDALQYQDDEDPVVAHRLFSDAIALAGGAA